MKLVHILKEAVQPFSKDDKLILIKVLRKYLFDEVQGKDLSKKYNENTIKDNDVNSWNTLIKGIKEADLNMEYLAYHLKAKFKKFKSMPFISSQHKKFEVSRFQNAVDLVDRFISDDIVNTTDDSNTGSDTKGSGSAVKPGVEELYEQNKELASIGSPEEYSKYLDTIFPSSKIKDIVYHGTSEEQLPKDGKFKGYVTYFTDNIEYAKKVKLSINRIVIAVLDIKSPYEATSEIDDGPEELHDEGILTNPSVIKYTTKGYDSVVGTDAGQEEGKTIAVFEPDQIHILGSKEDIEGFRKYMNK